MRPLIGIPTQADFREGSGRPIYCNNRAYVHAIEHAGGIPMLIPMLHDMSLLEALLMRLDGIIFSGGVDIQPRYYQEEKQPWLKEVDERLDEMEMHLMRQALQKDMPILGICRGMQLLNVALGGTLYQDITTEFPGSMEHCRRELSRNALIHNVRIAEGSRMEQVLGTNEIWSNSLHHQAIKAPGKGVFISGRAEDGIAELLEVPNSRFVLGIQGHPEEMYMTEPVYASLFQALVEACSSRSTMTTSTSSIKQAAAMLAASA